MGMYRIPLKYENVVAMKMKYENVVDSTVGEWPLPCCYVMRQEVFQTTHGNRIGGHWGQEKIYTKLLLALHAS